LKNKLLLFTIFISITVVSYGQLLRHTVVDFDGNVYHTVKIGTQTWMVENLKVTHYRNGDAIPNITNDTACNLFRSGAWCNYNNDSNIAKTYGRIYNWDAVNDSRKIAPKGWHIPTDAEWQILINFVGGKEVAGIKLKESDTTHWDSPNSDVTNETGFTALPGGIRGYFGLFQYLHTDAYFWSSTEEDKYGVTGLAFINRYNGETSLYIDKIADGNSVRCIKDQ
jgi:uncharacterized protein (TIGR02145 family)